MRRATSLTLLPFLVGVASAAERAPADELRDAEVEALALSGRADEVHRNFTERSGLIGVGEARERYKEAVYQYLLGQYEPAAMSFYILVQSRALGTESLARDSEWYLAECLFELDDYATAEEAYRLVVNRGESHPYFTDAVRRSLEVFALERNDAKFDEYYRQFIASGRVKTTDLITYTLGKAYYHRGQMAQATERFAGIPSTSSWYPRARFFLGTIKVKAGDYAGAIDEFREVDSSTATDPTNARVIEQGHLALARVLYETGDYASASDYYAKIPETSADYADALRESVWTFINQQRWVEATAAVDHFLEKFPDHRYTADMQILRGHLGMKRRAYDEALASYEKVVSLYAPVADTMEATAGDRSALRRYMAELASGKTTPAFNIPAYAEEMLRGRDEVSRSLGAWQTLQDQADEIGATEALARKLEMDVRAPGEKLQTFLVARQELAQVRAGALTLRSHLLELEGAYLRGRLPSAQRPLVSDVLKERNTVVAPGGSGSSAASQEAMARRALVQRYTDLHARLKALRVVVTDPTAIATFTRYDKLWESLAGVDANADQTDATLDEAEARELEAVTRRIAQEKAHAATLRAEIDAAAPTAEALAIDALGQGVGAVAATFRDDELQADKGIVDVFWLQKSETADALTTLAVDQTAAQRELDARYASLREGLK